MGQLPATHLGQLPSTHPGQSSTTHPGQSSTTQISQLPLHQFDHLLPSHINQIQPRDSTHDVSNKNGELTNKILTELHKLRLDMNQQQSTPEHKNINDLYQLNNLELQLQKLMQSNLVNDKQNQIQLFRLIKIFQELKNDLLLKTAKGSQNVETDQIKHKLYQLDSQLKNMAKMCLHAPNIMGYVSDGHHQIGLIDRQGQIDYITQSLGSRKPHYIALRNSQTPKQPMVLPAVMEYINQPQHKDHLLIGQVTDSSQKLTIGLIMKNQNQQYLLLISPIPKLKDIPIFAMTSTHKEIQNGQQQACPPIQPGQKCLPGLKPSLYQGDRNWIQTHTENKLTPEPTMQTDTRTQQVADSFDPQLLSSAQFDYLDAV